MPLIIAKIESRRGLLNLNEIIKSADGILVDEVVVWEMRISTVPHVVASIIQRCNSFGIPCYVATNVLDSMMVEALPSRAEISDMYHLLSSGASGFVLAAEVAIGKHPVESVQVVKYISQLFRHRQEDHGVIPFPREVVPEMQEPLNSWL